MKLEGRRVLVTGGAQGMGLLIAQGAAARGAHVAIWDVNSRALPAAAARISAARSGANQRVVSDVVDVGDPGVVASAAERLAASFGDVEVLINNAGVVSGKPFTELSPQEVERTLRVNTAALFWTARAFLPPMIAADAGHVVTMASAGGLIGVSRLSDYCASKFGAVGFHESLRAELRRTAPGLGTSLICPFFVGTGMFAGVRTRFPFLLPILAPERVAAAVVRAVETNRAVVVLPWFVHSLKFLRLLPVRWLDPLASFFGIHVAMDTFSGRPEAPRAARPR